MCTSGNVLGVNDAKHVYIARQYGINSFLTADGDFIALDNDNIYVPKKLVNFQRECQKKLEEIIFI